MTTTVVEVDSRRRISLGKSAKYERYVVREEPGGVLILEPAVIVTAAQARLNAMPELAAQLADAAAHPERAVSRQRRG